jgi:hypothetical protein
LRNRRFFGSILAFIRVIRGLNVFGCGEAALGNPRAKKFSRLENFSGTSSRISGNRWQMRNITRKGKTKNKIKRNDTHEHTNPNLN